jgi:hypothetical protein
VDLEDLRLAVYAGCRRGRVPRIADLATEPLATREQVRSGLVTLAAARHLALGSDGEITMAHPFTAVPLGFSVMGRDTPWWGGCAWDSVCVAALAAGPVSDAGGDGMPGVRPGPCVAGRECRRLAAKVAHFADYLRSVGLSGTFWGLTSR